MESNQPYNKINSNDGIWEGVGIGAASGLTIAGVGRMAPAVSDMSNKMKFKSLAKKADGLDPDSRRGFQVADQYNAFESKANKATMRNNKIRGAYSGWKGAAIGGTSALLGGIAGGIIDNYN